MRSCGLAGGLLPTNLVTVVYPAAEGTGVPQGCSGPLWYSRKMGAAPATDPPGAGLSLITLHWGECSEERVAWALQAFLEPKVKQLRQMPSKR